MSDEEIVPQTTRVVLREEKSEEDMNLHDFVKVSMPDDRFEGKDGQKSVFPKLKEEGSESESEAKLPPDYNASERRSGNVKNNEAKTDPRSINEQESDYRVLMPGSYDTTEPSFSPQLQHTHRIPRGPSIGWMDLFKRLQAHVAGLSGT